MPEGTTTQLEELLYADVLKPIRLQVERLKQQCQQEEREACLAIAQEKLALCLKEGWGPNSAPVAWLAEVVKALQARVHDRL